MLFLRCLIVALLSGVVVSCSGSAGSGDALLYAKRMPDGSTVEMVRGGRVSLTDCRAALGSKSFEGATALYSVRLQIHPVNKPPIVLWSRFKSHYDQPKNDGVDVLDVLVGPDRIIVATAEDEAISVWFLGFYMGDSPRALLESIDWTGSARSSFVSHDNVDAKIGRSADGSKIIVTVTERGQPANCTTVYEQTSSDAWPMAPTFAITSQVPTRAPLRRRDERLRNETGNGVGHRTAPINDGTHSP